MPRPALAAVLFAAMMVIGLLSQAAPVPAQMPPVPIEVAQVGSSCNALITRAMDSVSGACGALGRNQACYGNNLIHADLKAEASALFATTGDIAPLGSLQKIVTTPLDEAAQTWGIAVLKAQANIPDTLPGQNVTFILFGDTSVSNPTADMHAVTVSTGIGRASCADAPPSALLIQSPQEQPVTMNINGADVTLGSTILLTAYANDIMTISTIEGDVSVSALGQTQTVTTGTQVQLPLGTEDQLTVIGPPSEPETFDPGPLAKLPLALLPEQVTLPESTPEVTPTLVVCAPREDWTESYTIGPGDALSRIAARAGLSVGELQAGNCIFDANVIREGQVLRVPVLLATATPSAEVGTATAIALTPTWPAPTGPDLRADAMSLKYGKCTTIKWDTDFIKAVYFEGQPTTGHNQMKVCPKKSQTFTLRVVAPDDSERTYTIKITVGPKPTPTPTPVVMVCGNNVCDFGETFASCGFDCPLPSCGNGTCDSAEFEDINTCPTDCT